MASSPSILSRPSHEGGRQSEGRMTSRPPDPDTALDRVSEAPEELVTQCVGHDTEAEPDDRLPWRTAGPRVMVEQTVGASCDSDIFSVKNDLTLKTGLGFVQGHWKWHHLIDGIRV